MKENAKNKLNNILLRRDSKPKTVREVICCQGLSTTDQNAIVKLYDALVTEDKTRSIDINLIVEEGFPAFEATIGKSNFAKVKKYFGIGVKAPMKHVIKEADLKICLGKLRTIENAQYYITGYKEIIPKIAARLGDAPEEMSVLERAKFIRMYLVIFGGFNFFLEDYTSIQGEGMATTIIDYKKAQVNNKKPFNPEELFFLYEQKVKYYTNESMMYGVMYHEMKRIPDKRTRKEILEFGELNFVDGRFISVNQAPANQTFSSVRNIKRKLHTEPGTFPIELFCFKDMFSQLDLQEVYAVYKILKTTKIESLTKFDTNFRTFEGSRIVDKPYTCYRILGDMAVSGPVEAERFVYLMEFIASEEITMENKHDFEGNPLPKEDVKSYNPGIFLATIDFCNRSGYLSASTPLKRDFEVADIIMAQDKNGAIKQYKEEEISLEELKSKLEITSKFEKEVLGFVKQEAPEKTVARFCKKCGYITELTPEVKDVIENVIVPVNVKAIKKYATDEIGEEELKRQLGFEEKFTEMYFDLKKVDISLIEERLLEIKKPGKKKEINRNILLISFYCYLIDGQIPCGPRNRAPKRNKSLKTSNLRALL